MDNQDDDNRMTEEQAEHLRKAQAGELKPGSGHEPAPIDMNAIIRQAWERKR